MPRAKDLVEQLRQVQLKRRSRLGDLPDQRLMEDLWALVARRRDVAHYIEAMAPPVSGQR
jgi:hypothetical protein